MEKWTPESLKKQTSRATSDADLIKDGAKYVADKGADEPRLEISEKTLAVTRAFNEIIGGYDQSVIDRFFKTSAEECIPTENYGVLCFYLKPDGNFQGVKKEQSDNIKIPFMDLEEKYQEELVRRFKYKIGRVAKNMQK
ncbi:MAG: hypothetical protein AAB487_00425 [Patescibacteria group bacterium]